MSTTQALLELGYALDTFYLLISGALVMWMTAGFAMLEAGLVRAKNTTEILTKNMGLFAIACVMYLLVGYGLMHGDGNGLIPGYLPLLVEDHAAASVYQDTSESPRYSQLAYFFFQLVFVATAMSIVSGAVAERMKLWSFFAFAVVLTGFIYPVEAYWKWGGGWLQEMGFFDFAGSGVVHLCGGAAALAGAMILGPRHGKYRPDGRIIPIPGCNLPLATIGTLILWLGWFGFNGGSELRVSNIGEANSVARVFVTTNMAAAGGLIAALLSARLWFGKGDLTMALNGALAGLVAITADPLSPTPLMATLIGLLAGVVVVFSIVFIDRYLRIDDPVGAISVHGVGGILGLLLVPLSNAESGLLNQIIGIAAIFLWSFIASYAVWLLLRATIGVRVSLDEEYEGVDYSECGMEAYPEFTQNAD
ncbi:MAG: ammonium transporter [Wenzhouxiangellaceae bacterium]